MNVQHWEYVGRKYAEINEWLLTQRISSPGVLVHIFVSEESVSDAQYVVTAQLKQDPSVIKLYMSASLCWPITTFQTQASFLTCAIKSPKRIVDSFAFTFAGYRWFLPRTLGRVSLGCIPVSNTGRGTNWKLQNKLHSMESRKYLMHVKANKPMFTNQQIQWLHN